MVKTKELDYDYKDVVDIARSGSLDLAIEHINQFDKNTFAFDVVNNYCITTERIINSIDKETGRIGDSLWSEIEDLSMSPNVKVLKFSEAPIKSTLRYDKWKWLYVRMGISLNIFDQTVNYLRNRKIGDQEQIKLDLIKADIAQFLTQYTSIEVSVMCRNEYLLTNLNNLHTNLTYSDEYLVKLCGAHGYTVGGIIQSYYNSRIIQSIYGSGEEII
ncbi:hypothetical protein [Sporosarcina sp. 6E9]|uniref:hypothetical protein n=1 Tax=Sporosarcina sp. 6E9 TaxID=2819235 RepID=UPI001B30CC39|nr:hypothetical protein [Sporosarcina sp. 6E9]